jgi:homoserine kinase type II
MAAYTELRKPFLEQLADDYNFGRIGNVTGIPEGSVNSNYLIETVRGKYLLRVDEVKS